MESRTLVTALVVSLGVCLLVIGVFIGREMREPAPVAAPPVAAAPVKPPPPIFDPTAAPAPPPTSSEPAVAATSGDAQRAAQYFREIDRLQKVEVDNPQATAQSIVQAAASGDTSGIHKLVTQAQTAEARAHALTPPPTCAAYHKKVLAVLADDRAMMQQLESGLTSGSVDSLPALLTHANATKSRTDALAREERELKRRFGL
jgi:hypothetical protein